MISFSRSLCVQVLLDGSVAGILERNVPQNLTLSPTARADTNRNTQLDILVHSMGRVNFGCIWDFKGLVYPDVRLNGDTLAFYIPIIPLLYYRCTPTGAKLQQSQGEDWSPQATG